MKTATRWRPFSDYSTLYRGDIATWATPLDPQNLVFDGNKKKFELWEIKMLGYMKLKNLKMHFYKCRWHNRGTKWNSLCRAYTVSWWKILNPGNERSPILKEHLWYAIGSKPRIITLYNELTTLNKSYSETITDYLLRAENANRSVKEHVSDSLLIAMVLKDKKFFSKQEIIS